MSAIVASTAASAASAAPPPPPSAMKPCTPSALDILEATTACSSPLPSPGRQVRFGFGVKRHDGVCLVNRIFDDLVWDHISVSPYSTPAQVMRVVVTHLNRELDVLCCNANGGAGNGSHRNSSRNSGTANKGSVGVASKPCPSQLMRARSTSAASTDSDSDEPQVPSVSQLLHSLHHLANDLCQRITSAVARSPPFQLHSVSVPVLPRGGGYAAKLSFSHLRYVEVLATLLAEAHRSPATTPLPAMV